MSGLWQRYAARFDALTLRERVMVFAGVMVALLAVSYTGMIEPQLAKQKRLSGALLQKHSEMKAFDAQVAKLVGARGLDAGGERERLVRVRAELAALEARISAEERKFTAPSQMRSVVEGLLTRNGGVSLVELKTLAVDTVASGVTAGTKPPAKPVAAERLIYRHGMALTVTGSYLDLLAYARELEKRPRQLYWGALELDAAGYPKVVMRMTIYTLSLDPAWLSV